MKHLILSAALGLGLASMASADPVDGTWKTQSDENGGYLHVLIAPCGSAICGTIAEAINKDGEVSSDYEHLGKKMLWDMTAQGQGAYGGGQIWAPDNGKTYRSKMELDGNKLTVKGCVAGGLICRNGGIWSRVK